MRSKARLWRWIAVLGVFGLIAAACGGAEPTTTPAAPPPETTAPGDVTATTTGPPPVAGFTYEVGIISDPATENFWNYLDVNNDVYTAYVNGAFGPGLWTQQPPTYSFVPALATGDIPEGQAEGDKWVMDVALRQDALWSDGKAITANDVAFTFNTVRDVGLSGNWPVIWPQAAEGVNGIESIEVVDDYNLRVVWNSQPGLANWHFNAATAPVMPEHYWAPFVDEAKAAGQAAADAIADPKQAAFDAQKAAAEEAGEEFTKTVDDITDEEAAAHVDSVFKATASQTLEGAPGLGMPSGGSFVFTEREAGAFWRNTSVEGYYDSGFTYKVYDAGAVTITDPTGTEITVSGEPSGNILAEYTVGPYAAEQLFKVYGTQDAAALALLNGEIQYWMNPLTLSRGLQGQFLEDETLVLTANPSNSLFYFAFNMRKFPGSDPVYRQAVACMIDKQFVSQNVLAGQVITVNSIIPPGNAFWANPNPVAPPCDGLGQVERLEAAVALLKEAGWTWEKEPVAEARDVTAGTGLRGPGGETLSEMRIYAPGPGYDPMRATYSLFIQNAMNDLGIPIIAEPTGFTTIVNLAFGSNDWDAYILGWGLTIFPDYVADFFVSSQDSVLYGGNNTPGYSVPEFDALGEQLKTTTDITEAQQIAWQMDTLIGEDLPYVTLFTNITYDVYSNRIQFPFTQVLDGIQNFLGVPDLVTSAQ